MSKLAWAQVVLLALSMALIAHGLQRGEALALLLKGASICLECIGLG